MSIEAEWGKMFLSEDITKNEAFQMGYRVSAISESGKCGQFVYVPPQGTDPQPLFYNIDIGYKFQNGHWFRTGRMRKLRIKRFGKTSIKVVSEKSWTVGRILNDKWLHNLNFKLE